MNAHIRIQDGCLVLNIADPGNSAGLHENVSWFVSEGEIRIKADKCEFGLNMNGSLGALVTRAEAHHSSLERSDRRKYFGLFGPMVRTWKVERGIVRLKGTEPRAYQSNHYIIIQ